MFIFSRRLALFLGISTLLLLALFLPNEAKSSSSSSRSSSSSKSSVSKTASKASNKQHKHSSSHHKSHSSHSSESNEQQNNTTNGVVDSALQSVEANGTLLCKGRPARDVRVKLYDEDHLEDDLLDSVLTSPQGTFRLAGNTNERTNIEPRLYIYHDCEDAKPCQRRFVIEIPESYINRPGGGTNSTSNRVYQAGDIELGGQRPDEDRDCIH